METPNNRVECLLTVSSDLELTYIGTTRRPSSETTAPTSSAPGRTPLQTYAIVVNDETRAHQIVKMLAAVGHTLHP
jgi:hypothetical protein